MSAGARIRLTAALVAGALLTGQAPARAQEAGPSRFEAAASAAFMGNSGLGSRDAELAPNLGRPALVLFSTTAELTSPTGIDARLGLRVTPSLVVSASSSVSWADLAVSIGGDAEMTGTRRIVGERLLQARIEGRIDWLVGRLQFAGGRAVPYLTASVGVLQQWHEDYTIKEDGKSVLAGGGVRYLLRRRPDSRFSQAGLAVEVQVCHLRGGYHLGADSRTMPAFSVGMFTGWGKRQ